MSPLIDILSARPNFRRLANEFLALRALENGDEILVDPHAIARRKRDVIRSGISFLELLFLQNDAIEGKKWPLATAIGNVVGITTIEKKEHHHAVKRAYEVRNRLVHPQIGHSSELEVHRAAAEVVWYLRLAFSAWIVLRGEFGEEQQWLACLRELPKPVLGYAAATSRAASWVKGVLPRETDAERAFGSPPIDDRNR